MEGLIEEVVRDDDFNGSLRMSVELNVCSGLCGWGRVRTSDVRI